MERWPKKVPAFMPVMSFMERKSRLFMAFMGVMAFMALSGSALAVSDPYAALLERLEEDRIHLGVADVVGLALENNLGLQVGRYDPMIQKTRISFEKGIFDPTAFGQANFDNNQFPTSTTIAGTRMETLGVSVGLRQRIPVGGQLEFRFDNTRTLTNAPVSFLNPEYRAITRLSLTQPLLKGFGIDVTRSRITLAEIQTEVEDLNLKQRAIQVAEQTEKAYWDLVLAYAKLDEAKESRERARMLLEENRNRVRLGQLPEVEVVQAEAEVAARESNIIAAKKQTKDMDEQLKMMLNLPPGAALWEKSVFPVDKPRLMDVDLSFIRSVQVALEKRVEVITNELNLKGGYVARKVAKNATLPALNLQASYSLQGLSGNQRMGDILGFGGLGGFQNLPQRFQGGYNQSLDVLGSADFPEWVVGLQFEYPIGNRAAKADLAQADLRIKQSVAQQAQIQQQVATELREIIRRVESSKDQVEAATVSVALSERRLAEEERKLHYGLSTSFDVLQMQERLIAQKSQLSQAQNQYMRALVDLDRAKGILLDTRLSKLANQEN
ncbi:MAG: TolC family protein [Nitrospirota bacterium]|nr:TolC family protein [Nitrospirota bacterium]